VIRVLGKVGKTFARASISSQGPRRQVPLANVKVEEIDPLRDGDEWDRAIFSHPDAGIFHSSAWARVLHKTYGHTPLYLRCVQDGELIALVPLMEIRSRITGRRGVCLPFADHCAPLLFNAARGGQNEIIETLLGIARSRNWRHIEFRGAARVGADASGAQDGVDPFFVPPSTATPSLAFYGHSLDLRGGADALLANCQASVRRAIAKAERSDLRVQITRSREAVIAFYNLHMRTRRRHGNPPQPLSFFLNIHDEIIAPGNGFVVLAEEDAQPIAAAMFFQTRTQALFKFGASDETRQELRGNNLVMWEAIRFLASNNARECHTLDFGRTSLDNEGLRRFKLGWGTTEKTLSYFRFDPAANTWVCGRRDRASGLHTALFRRLPLTVNRIAGAILYPHLD
jgi:hypothetical protein